MNDGEQDHDMNQIDDVAKTHVGFFNKKQRQQASPSSSSEDPSQEQDGASVNGLE